MKCKYSTECKRSHGSLSVPISPLLGDALHYFSNRSLFTYIIRYIGKAFINLPFINIKGVDVVAF